MHVFEAFKRCRPSVIGDNAMGGEMEGDDV